MQVERGCKSASLCCNWCCCCCWWWWWQICILFRRLRFVRCRRGGLWCRHRAERADVCGIGKAVAGNLFRGVLLFSPLPSFPSFIFPFPIPSFRSRSAFFRFGAKRPLKSSQGLVEHCSFSNCMYLQSREHVCRVATNVLFLLNKILKLKQRCSGDPLW